MLLILMLNFCLSSISLHLGRAVAKYGWNLWANTICLPIVPLPCSLVLTPLLVPSTWSSCKRIDFLLAAHFTYNFPITIGYVTGQPFCGDILVRFCATVKSWQLFWRSGSHRWNLWVPDLHTNYKDLFYSQSIEILFCSYPNSNWVITTKFCTCHDSCAVVACAKICSHLMANNWTCDINFTSYLNCDLKIASEMGLESLAKPSILGQSGTGACPLDNRSHDWISDM